MFFFNRNQVNSIELYLWQNTIVRI